MAPVIQPEPGTLRFDVLVPGKAADQIILYEVYESTDDEGPADRHPCLDRHPWRPDRCSGMAKKRVSPAAAASCSVRR